MKESLFEITDEQGANVVCLRDNLPLLAEAIGTYENAVDFGDAELADIEARRVRLYAARAASAFELLLAGDLLEGLGEIGDRVRHVPGDFVGGGCSRLSCTGTSGCGVADCCGVGHENTSSTVDGQVLITPASVVKTVEGTTDDLLPSSVEVPGVAPTNPGTAPNQRTHSSLSSPFARERNSAGVSAAMGITAATGGSVSTHVPAATAVPDFGQGNAGTAKLPRLEHGSSAG